MQELIADDNFITEKVIQSVLTSVQNPYNLGLPASSYEWLAHVALDHELVLQEETPATRAYQDMAIVSLAVLFYRNDSNWFDLNPAVRQIDSIKRAIESLQNSRIQQQK